MQRCVLGILLVILTLSMVACSGTSSISPSEASSASADTGASENPGAEESSAGEDLPKEETEVGLKLEIGDHVFTAALEENSSADALKELLADGPMTLVMTDYAGMEKGADLGTVLPQNNEQMDTQAGDIILYQGRTLVIYYDTNSWSLTPIGKIEHTTAEELQQVLGTGSVTVTLSIEPNGKEP